jgi:riboflavin synthase
MFTGIVEARGSVLEAGPRLSVAAGTVVADCAPGASLAVSGCCLTVAERTATGDGGATLRFDLSPETLARTSLGRLAVGDPVNLERPVTLMTRLGGHLVQGHVDGVGRVVSVEAADPGAEMTIEVPDGLVRYLVDKGSIAVDGVSLTVTHLAGDRFGVALIPFTLEATTLGTARPGDPVNLEVDVMAKYAEGFLRRAT